MAPDTPTTLLHGFNVDEMMVGAILWTDLDLKVGIRLPLQPQPFCLSFHHPGFTIWLMDMPQLKGLCPTFALISPSLGAGCVTLIFGTFSYICIEEITGLLKCEDLQLSTFHDRKRLGTFKERRMELSKCTSED